ncbi:MAG: hypothetical protein HYU66_22135 [Armatimonadetes bacterium]|nr:hypothetical protein [Armatimonadota bacterium]
MQPEPPPAGRRWICTVVLVLAAAAAGWAYWTMLDNFFVCDDACYLKVGKSILASPRLALHQQDLFRQYVGADMRPLGNVLFAGLYALFGTEPRGYYLLLLGLHLVNVWLVARVLVRWLRDAPVAVAAAALFATAYGVRNGVCWISNLNESFCLTLELLAFDLARRRESAPGLPLPEAAPGQPVPEAAPGHPLPEAAPGHPLLGKEGVAGMAVGPGGSPPPWSSPAA